MSHSADPGRERHSRQSGPQPGPLGTGVLPLPPPAWDQLLGLSIHVAKSSRVSASGQVTSGDWPVRGPRLVSGERGKDWLSLGHPSTLTPASQGQRAGSQGTSALPRARLREESKGWLAP